MSQRRSARRTNPSATTRPDEPVSVRPPRRRPLPWILLAFSTLFVLVVALATLAFWYYAASTGFFNLSEPLLYFVRSAGLIGLLIAGIGVFVAVGTFRRNAVPTADLLEGMEAATNGDLNVALEERGPRELRALTRAFNDLLGRLRDRQARETALELHSARQLRSRLEATQNAFEAGAPARDAISQLARYVDDWSLLVLASNAELPIERAPTDLGALVQSVLAFLHPEASARGINLAATVPDPSPIAPVDGERVRQIVERLVTDALARSASRAEITVDVEEQSRPRRAELTVHVNRHLIDEETVPKLFDAPSEADSCSSGLELLVARRLAELLEGQVMVTSEGESGTNYRVTLPLL